MSEVNKTYNNLADVVPSLPASTYLDAKVFDQEMRDLWYREWVYAAHISQLSETGDYKLVHLGNQEILLVNTAEGVRAFHNTCRHRGSALCTEDSGHFPRQNIQCPYHHWTYDLNGNLIRTPNLEDGLSLNQDELGLYEVGAELWSGCIFINLSKQAGASLASGIQPEPNILDNWSVDSLQIAHTFETVLDCNWKIVWENFLECYHCPGIHKDLSNLVPIYKRTFMEKEDERDWERHEELEDPKFAGGLSEGNYSWTMDGQLHGERFPDITEAEFKAGYVYAQHLPSMFIVGHPDYVRVVWLRPEGPTQTRFTSHWLLTEASLKKPDLALDKIVDFGMTVIQEDARVCELNQRGLRALPHEGGILVPQEYDVLNFHEWVRSRMSS